MEFEENMKCLGVDKSGKTCHEIKLTDHTLDEVIECLVKLREKFGGEMQVCTTDIDFNSGIEIYDRGVSILVRD